jgi:hypothetical protein
MCSEPSAPRADAAIRHEDSTGAVHAGEEVSGDSRAIRKIRRVHPRGRFFPRNRGEFLRWFLATKRRCSCIRAVRVPVAAAGS